MKNFKTYFLSFIFFGCFGSESLTAQNATTYSSVIFAGDSVQLQAMAIQAAKMREAIGILSQGPYNWEPWLVAEVFPNGLTHPQGLSVSQVSQALADRVVIAAATNGEMPYLADGRICNTPQLLQEFKTEVVQKMLAPFENGTIDPVNSQSLSTFLNNPDSKILIVQQYEGSKFSNIGLGSSRYSSTVMTDLLPTGTQVPVGNGTPHIYIGRPDLVTAQAANEALKHEGGHFLQYTYKKAGIASYQNFLGPGTDMATHVPLDEMHAHLISKPMQPHLAAAGAADGYGPAFYAISNKLPELENAPTATKYLVFRELAKQSESSVGACLNDASNVARFQSIIREAPQVTSTISMGQINSLVVKLEQGATEFSAVDSAGARYAGSSPRGMPIAGKAVQTSEALTATERAAQGSRFVSEGSRMATMLRYLGRFGMAVGVLFGLHKVATAQDGSDVAEGVGMIGTMANPLVGLVYIPASFARDYWIQEDQRYTRSQNNLLNQFDQNIARQLILEGIVIKYRLGALSLAEAQQQINQRPDLIKMNQAAMQADINAAMAVGALDSVSIQTIERAWDIMHHEHLVPITRTIPFTGGTETNMELPPHMKLRFDQVPARTNSFYQIAEIYSTNPQYGGVSTKRSFNTDILKGLNTKYNAGNIFPGSPNPIPPIPNQWRSSAPTPPPSTQIPDSLKNRPTMPFADNAFPNFPVPVDFGSRYTGEGSNYQPSPGAIDGNLGISRGVGASSAGASPVTSMGPSNFNFDAGSAFSDIPNGDGTFDMTPNPGWSAPASTVGNIPSTSSGETGPLAQNPTKAPQTPFRLISFGINFVNDFVQYAVRYDIDAIENGYQSNVTRRSDPVTRNLGAMNVPESPVASGATPFRSNPSFTIGNWSFSWNFDFDGYFNISANNYVNGQSYWVNLPSPF